VPPDCDKKYVGHISSISLRDLKNTYFLLKTIVTVQNSRNAFRKLTTPVRKQRTVCKVSISTKKVFTRTQKRNPIFKKELNKINN